MKLINIIGKRFNRWLVLTRAENDKQGKPMYLCRCDCGNEVVVRGNDLRSGNSKSCGCLQKERVSEAHKGKIVSTETRKKISGENNPNWRGGITTESHKKRNSPEYKEWRSLVYEKDNYTCQFCEDNSGGNLNAHHIFGFTQFPGLSFNINNGITLCKECHGWMHSKENKNNIFIGEITNG